MPRIGRGSKAVQGVVAQSANRTVAQTVTFTDAVVGSVTWGSGPVMSAYGSSSITDTSATVTWSLSRVATGYVQYGLTTGYGSVTATESSFNYSTHVQSITGLTAGTLYHWRPRSTDSQGNETIGADQTFTTAASASAFDLGYTYTDVVWPTGAGYTSGSTTTARTNMQTLIDNAGSGASSTAHVRHILAAGATYTVDTYLSINGLSHVTFEFSGTENTTTGTWGQSGGATLVTQSNGDGTGDTSIKACFSAGQGGTTARFSDVRWHAGTLQGNGTSLASSTAYAPGGKEYQYLISSFGGDNGVVDHMILTDAAGDCIELQDSNGSDGTTGHASTGWVIRYNRLLRTNRVCLAMQSAANTLIQYNYFADPALAYIDVEPDNSTQINSNLTIRDNVFGGRWMWNVASFDMSAIYITQPVGGQTCQFNGYMRIQSNTLTGICSSNTTSTRRTFVGAMNFSPFQINGEVTITDNVNSGGQTSAGPRCYVFNAPTGPIVVTGNTGWCSSGSFLSTSGSATPTNTGNT